MNQPQSGSSQVNNYQFTGGINTVGTTAAGNIIQFQTVPQPSNVDEILRLLSELGPRIAASELPEAERTRCLTKVQQLSEELRRPEVRPSMLADIWEPLQKIGTLVSVYQGGPIVKDLIDKLGAHLAPLLQGPPPGV